MRVGFFFQNPVNIEPLLDIALRNNLDLVGVYFKNPGSVLANHPKICEFEDELLVQIDVAIVFLDSATYFDFTTKALKRGVNVFLASLPDYTHASLIEINELAFEIGVPVGFGCAGTILIRQDEIIGNYFMLQLTRDAGSDINDEVFRRMLICDIASFVRIKPSGMRKLRVNGLPLFTKSPKAINLRMEYDNGSLIASSITRVDEPEKCVLRFFSGNDGYFKDLLTQSTFFSENILNTPDLLIGDIGFLTNLELYLQELQGKSALSFGLENAIETYNIIEAIEGRLYPTN
jgi:hypothetical protein